MSGQHRVKNGSGESGQISLLFNLDDETERIAYEMARKLARPHGRRKDLVVALFYGLHLYEQRTQARLSADRVMGMLMAGTFLGTGGVFEPASYAKRPEFLHEPLIEVRTDRKVTAEEMAENFIQSVGGLSGLFS